MAGDWIKVEENMTDKPEVAEIAALLSISDPDAVAGKLLRVWSWATRNCNADGVTNVTAKPFIDRCAGVTGFSDAMIGVEWLGVGDGKLFFPNFTRHCSQTAKERANTNRRVSKHREKSNDKTVTNVTPKPLQKPLPEKRREEYIKKERESGDSRHRRPTLSQAKSAASQIGITEDKAEEWWNCREASEWLKGMAGGATSPVGSNWQADLTTYAKRGGYGSGNSNHREEKRSKEFKENIKLKMI